jgi:CheY-like chemotaxis protein|tara:strand:- start:4902 stop:5099 length:198 start_codon:yes stop_codon:yes gene_type:complete
MWIIGLTANATNIDREKALQVGMNNYLAKPIKITDLTFALSEAASALGVVKPSKGTSNSQAAFSA